MIYLNVEKKKRINNNQKGAKGKPIICDQTGLYCKSMASMAITMGISYPLMARQITGKCPHAKGYTFHYASEEEIKQAEGK